MDRVQPAVEPEEQQDTPTGVSEDVKSTVLVNRGVREIPLARIIHEGS